MVTNYTCNKCNHNSGTFKPLFYLQTLLLVFKLNQVAYPGALQVKCIVPGTPVHVSGKESLSAFAAEAATKCQDNLNLSIKNVGPYLRVISNKGKYTESFQVHANHLM